MLRRAPMATAPDSGSTRRTSGRGPDILGIDERPPRSTPTGRSATPSAPPSPSAAGRPDGRPPLRGAEARRAAPPLRPAPRDGRRAQELGGAQGALAARGGEAARGPRRGPPARVRRLRGRDPRRQLRRRRGHRVGPRLVPARSSPRTRASSSQRGKLEVELFGHKLRGRWTLARMGGKDKDWLLLKKADGCRRPRRRRPSAIPSRCSPGSPSRRCATRPARGWPRCARRSRRCGAPRGDVVARAAAGSCSPPWPSAPFSRARLALRDQVRRRARARRARRRRASRSRPERPGHHRALSRSRRARCARCRSTRFVLDGEIVALDDARRAELPAAAGAHGASPTRATSSARAAHGAGARPSSSTASRSRAAICGAAARRAQGVPAARAAAARRRPLRRPRGRAGRGLLRGGRRAAARGHRRQARARAATRAARTRDWLKIKCQLRQEFVIGGYTDPQGARGSLRRAAPGRLRRPGGAAPRLRRRKVGTGFDEATLAAIVGAAAAARRARPRRSTRGTPTGPRPPLGRAALVAEVRFTDGREDGGLRHPAFLGLRDDKRREECRRETAAELPRAGQHPLWEPAGAPGAVDRSGGTSERGRTTARCRRSAATGTRSSPTRRRSSGRRRATPRRDLDRLLRARSRRWLLPYLRDRPLVLTRYPDGINGQVLLPEGCAGPGRPRGSAPSASTPRDAERDIDYFVVDDVETLRYVANTGTIPLHLWASRLSVARAARLARARSRPQGRAVHRRGQVALALRAHPGRAGAAELREDVGRDRPAHPAAAGRPLRLRGDADLRAAAGDAGRRGAARHLHDRAAARARAAARSTSTSARTAGARPSSRPFSVRPLPGRAGLLPAALAEVTAQLDPARFTIRTAPGALRQATAIRWRRCSTRASTSPPRSPGWSAHGERRPRTVRGM